jgi:uncharacterized membrane protein YidH (DUF202 family)
MRQRTTAGLIAAALGVSLFATAMPGAQAGSKGRKNTALGLGALAVYELLQGKTTNGLIAGAAAAYAYKRYNDARKDERRYSRYDSRSRYVPGSYNALAYEPYSRYGTSSTYRSYSRYPTTGSYRTARTYRTSRPYRSRTRHRSVSRTRYTSRYGTRYTRVTPTYRSSERVAGYRRVYRNSSGNPPGWSRGRKTGWNGHSMPPGQWRKQHPNDQ